MPKLGGQPEDFRVEEIPLYPPSGVGDHTFVRVEKRLCTTEAVAGELARQAGVRARDVGYAGRKDRVAVARQWLSVPGLAPERALAIEAEGFRVLEAVPHRHRLRTGQLRGNRFVLRVEGVDAAAAEVARVRLAELVRRGMPNPFGGQRFGRDGDNAERARALLAGERPPRDRRAARFLLSALQAELFNAVLLDRGDALDILETGDVACVHASGGLFVVDDVAVEQPRAAAFEISATGPIFGRRMKAGFGAPAERESRLRRELGIPEDAELRPPPGLRMRGARRPLRVQPLEPKLTHCPPDSLELSFALPAGSYATIFVETLLGPGAGRRVTGPGPSRTLGPASADTAEGRS